MIVCGWRNREENFEYTVSADSDSFSSLYCFEFDNKEEAIKVIKKIKLIGATSFKVYGNGRVLSTHWLCVDLLHTLPELIIDRKRI